MAPTVMALSATLKAGNDPAAMIDLDEISDGLVNDAVVQVAGRAAEDE